MFLVELKTFSIFNGMDLRTLGAALNQIAEEKGIAKEKVLDAIEMALAAAYKKDYGERGQLIRAKLDLENGRIELWQVKLVVDESMIKTEEEIAAAREAAERGEFVPQEEEQDDEGKPKKVRFNPERHIMQDEARAINPQITLGEEMVFALETKEDFGRVAAQTAKQVILQRLREAERESIHEEFTEKTGQIMSGVVQRMEGAYVFVDVGKAVAILLPKDQAPRDRYRPGERLRFYVLGIEQSPRGPQVYVSRTHPKLISKLFELEVPEIAGDSVEIKAIAREPGERSKIAVASKEEGVDPIGACVGQRGTRVGAVIQELGGEKIDIIEWRESPAEFVAAALSPAKVTDVKLEGARAIASVSEDQLSLAIGRGGQNVRLAAKLTGWRIDIRSKETGEIEETSEKEVSEEKVEEGEEAPAQEGGDVPVSEVVEEKESTETTEKPKPAKRTRKAKKEEAEAEEEKEETAEISSQEEKNGEVEKES